MHKAIKLSLIYLTAFVCLAPSVSLNAELTPENAGVEVFKNFFTQPEKEYVHTKSFESMCREAIPHLEKSKDSQVVQLVTALKKIAASANPMVIGTALKKYKDVIVKYLIQAGAVKTEKDIVDATTLFKRLVAALTLKK